MYSVILLDGAAEIDASFDVPYKYLVSTIRKLQDSGFKTIKFAPPEEPIGAAAPSLAITDINGKELKLKDLRGKYVLLYFWTTWCQPCIAKMNDVERLRSEMGNLVVIGMNLDSDQKLARNFLNDKPLPWVHTFLGDPQKNEFAQQLTISSVPTYVFIDPQGRIVSRGNRIEDISRVDESKVDKEDASDTIKHFRK